MIFFSGCSDTKYVDDSKLRYFVSGQSEEGDAIDVIVTNKTGVELDFIEVVFEIREARWGTRSGVDVGNKIGEAKIGVSTTFEADDSIELRVPITLWGSVPVDGTIHADVSYIVGSKGNKKFVYDPSHVK